MHYFSIYSQQDEHLGFLIMQTDDENDGGQFAIKWQNELVNPNFQAASELIRLSESEEALFWQPEKEHIRLQDANGQLLGFIKQQYLTLGGQHFLLNDLTGIF